MKFTRRSVGGLLVGMGIAFAGLAFVYAQTAADADFDGDGKVGFSDFVSFAGKFGTSRGDGRYEAKYDLNGDGQVGFHGFCGVRRIFRSKCCSQRPAGIGADRRPGRTKRRYTDHRTGRFRSGRG